MTYPGSYDYESFFQDTVVGIQALAEYASAIFGGVVNLQVRFRQDEDEDEDKVVKFDINADNALVLNTVRDRKSTLPIVVNLHEFAQIYSNLH